MGVGVPKIGCIGVQRVVGFLCFAWTCTSFAIGVCIRPIRPWSWENREGVHAVET